MTLELPRDTSRLLKRRGRVLKNNASGLGSIPGRAGCDSGRVFNLSVIVQ